MFNILTFTFIISLSFCLLVPLTDSTRQRCMIMYSFGEQETIKLDLHFPPIPNKLPGEVYDFYIKNTQTKQEQRDIVYQGNHKVQVHLQKSIIYDVCFSIRSNRRLQNQLLVDYNADLQFIFKAQHIKVPQNLLKSRDLVRTYQNAVTISQINDVINRQYRNLFNSKNQEKSKSQEHSKITDNWQFQLILIIGIAIAQVFILRRFLIQGKYI